MDTTLRSLNWDGIAWLAGHPLLLLIAFVKRERDGLEHEVSEVRAGQCSQQLSIFTNQLLQETHWRAFRYILALANVKTASSLHKRAGGENNLVQHGKLQGTFKGWAAGDYDLNALYSGMRLPKNKSK